MHIFVVFLVFFSFTVLDTSGLTCATQDSKHNRKPLWVQRNFKKIFIRKKKWHPQVRFQWAVQSLMMLKCSHILFLSLSPSNRLARQCVFCYFSPILFIFFFFTSFLPHRPNLSNFHKTHRKVWSSATTLGSQWPESSGRVTRPPPRCILHWLWNIKKYCSSWLWFHYYCWRRNCQRGGRRF